MKVLQSTLLLLIIINFIKISHSDDGLDLIAMKRPFCNAFTGCGRKRDPAYAGPGYEGLQLPVPVYRALLRVAADAEARMRLRHAQAEPRVY
ncbi:PREDICTED: cardioactive peptide-like [Ceratosolen solmsi marchali]|uniref:Cardioactive peptide-like n=1 Tax=Ceratosolen solmsi marchali TaxID=326594 RepID=A0AAJ6VNI9_9HYME|nr:PREDICTED: cardioactive peptide-like [Ceratosolen solmsi marchali]